MKEFFVSKLSFQEEERLIDKIYIYEYDGINLDSGSVKDRQWLVNKYNSNYKISTISPNSKKEGNWIRGQEFSYNNNLFSWHSSLPQNITKRKVFLSYYHDEDQYYKEIFKNLFHDLIVNKSVEKDDIDDDNCDEYIKQLIQKDYLADTTVLVVLIGPNTRHRMHIDWEISGALNLKVGDKYAGLLGIKLPNHPDYNTGNHTYDLLPARLSDNLKSGYAIIRDWSEDRVKIQEHIEEAFAKRGTELVNKIMLGYK